MSFTNEDWLRKCKEMFNLSEEYDELEIKFDKLKDENEDLEQEVMSLERKLSRSYDLEELAFRIELGISETVPQLIRISLPS